MTVRRAAAALFCAFLVTACAKKTAQDVTAPAFTLKDLSGKTVSLAEFRGHPVFLDFWATWCAPCQVSIPLVEKFYQRHKSQGLVVLGMNVDNDPSVVYPFVKHFKMTYPVLLTGDSDLPSTYQLDGIPAFFLIDQKGRVVQAYQGFSDAMPDAWEMDLQHLLSAPH